MRDSSLDCDTCVSLTSVSDKLPTDCMSHLHVRAFFNYASSQYLQLWEKEILYRINDYVLILSAPNTPLPAQTGPWVNSGFGPHL